MVLGAVADIHGNFEALTQAMERHPDVLLWICVGDVASRTGAYPTPPRPLFWIKGNNEDFERIAAWEGGDAQPPNLHYIRNGTATDVGSLRVAGLGGTFAPKWFEARAVDLAPGRRDAAFEKRDDKRRHFVRDEAEACKRLAPIDILMTHEAARPFIVVEEPLDSLDVALARGRPAARRKPRRFDAGKPAINEVLATLKPRLHLCGHHHRFSETMREGVPSVCIDRVNRSYLLIDAETLDYRRLDQ
jgi:calcineurin-like phosphoesterase family protein